MLILPPGLCLVGRGAPTSLGSCRKSPAALAVSLCYEKARPPLPHLCEPLPGGKESGSLYPGAGQKGAVSEVSPARPSPLGDRLAGEASAVLAAAGAGGDKGTSPAAGVGGARASLRTPGGSRCLGPWGTASSAHGGLGGVSPRVWGCRRGMWVLLFSGAVHGPWAVRRGARCPAVPLPAGGARLPAGGRGWQAPAAGGLPHHNPGQSVPLPAAQQ